MPSKLKKAIGAVKDQTSISFAKVAGNASSLEVAILKATSHEEIPMDERHVAEILRFVSANKYYASVCAHAIGRRIGRTRNWVVALKSLMLVLRIFQDGDPYFPREVLHAMKRGAKILNLANFRDDSNSSSWDYTGFVRIFALYLDERLDCFLTGKLQRRYTNRDDDSHGRRRSGSRRYEPAVRDMKPVMLLDKVSYWQRLLDRAVATRPTGEARSNSLVRHSLYAVVRESFDLYKDISDGLALLLDSFFHLQHQSCLQAFKACVRASKQFEELNEFYDLCKSNGVGRSSEYPSVQKISEELIETLQEFLKDQSSFPASGRSPLQNPAPAVSSNLLLQAGPSTRRSTTLTSGSHGGSFDTSERYSDCGPYGTSLEDLMSMNEAGTSPATSSGSEPHGKNRDRNAFDTASTHSLPNDVGSNLMTNAFDGVLDAVSSYSLPDIVGSNLRPLTNAFDAASSHSRAGSNLNSELVPNDVRTNTTWPATNAFDTAPSHSRAGSNLSVELVPRDIARNRWPARNAFDTTSSHSRAGSNLNLELVLFDDKDQGQREERHSWELMLGGQGGDKKGGNWELVLEETVTKPGNNNHFQGSRSEFSNGFPDNIKDSQFVENTQAAQSQKSYNPFLDDSAIVPAAVESSTAGSNAILPFQLDFFAMDPLPPPTFQATATPTCQARSSGMKMATFEDPFAESSEVKFNGRASGKGFEFDQVTVLQEQQLWLENQNKIIAKHFS